MSLLLIMCFLAAGSLNAKSITINADLKNIKHTSKGDVNKLDSAILGGGCFWCIEAILNELKGVEKVESGYSGGNIKNPTYQEVCTGKTGHAEVVKITFDPEIISYGKLIEIFFHIHDPTTLNRQGNDVGTQYRSVIFYNSEAQKKTAEEVIKNISDSGLWSDPVVTVVEALEAYYPAEDYHQDYYNNNKEKSYCSIVIAPKIAKFYEEYKDLIKN
ncbi:MAG TPA: peptide-methionine (S)-S-oxide reductase MsrA [Ignavibacteria bacterium]|nr:peptide-methionine (S)-S-oxide reductase MsrA [Ignavibacteria bacterium]HMR41874.1 peptide-methionine (S)-S-oxide reductase MsrA [Ignavibacteria bacterium]